MKKYLRYSCSVCKRFADRLVDNVRAMPDKCTITFKCEGRLFPVQYRSDGGITTAPEVGIVDWRARGTSITNLLDDQAQTFLDTATGTTQQVVLAVQLNPIMSFVPTTDGTEAGAVLKLKLNQRSDTPKNYKAYVYRMDSAFSTVSGVESGLEKKTLRYATTDTVEVFINGVKQELGAFGIGTYQIYDGIAQAPPNTIVFNPTVSLPGITQIDVIITATSTTTQTELTFHRNVSDESRLATGSWENVNYVERFDGINWQKWYLFTLDLTDATELVLNTIMTATASATVNGTINVPAVNMMLLLARKPYSILDRYTNLVVPLTTLTFERDFLKYFAVNGKAVLYVTETAKQTVYPPLHIIKFNIEKTIQTTLAGVIDQIIVDGSVIVGPDA
jgi:hypothetical protein